MSNAAKAGSGVGVLVVCTANQCRSPIAEHLLRQTLEEAGLDWSVSSAGVRAREGLPMDTNAEAILLGRHLLGEGWETHRLTADQVKAAELVLTAEVAHRHSVVGLAPAAVRYTFTLVEFGHLLALALAENPKADPATSPAELIQRVVEARSLPQSRDDRLLDIVDPIGQSTAVFGEVTAVIEDAVRAIGRTLGVEPDAEPTESEAEAPVA
jgi:protein-tyrosine phosphatase